MHNFVFLHPTLARPFTLKLKIILHSFEGNNKQIQEAIKQGYYFSIPTSIKRSTHFQKLVDITPLSKLLTENEIEEKINMNINRKYKGKTKKSMLPYRLYYLEIQEIQIDVTISQCRTPDIGYI